MVNQICIAGLVQGLSEGLHFAKKAGLDIEKLVATISKGAAQSWQMENRYKTMAADKFDFGFAVDWMRKDLGICLGEARKNGAKLPVTALVDQFYAEVQSMGGNRWDTSALIARLDRKYTLRHSRGRLRASLTRDGGVRNDDDEFQNSSVRPSAATSTPATFASSAFASMVGFMWVIMVRFAPRSPSRLLRMSQLIWPVSLPAWA
jgi:hypothetical protein